MLSPANTHHDRISSGHYAFLRRAAHDPRFLAALEADPQAALAKYGLSVDPDEIPTRVTPPSAEHILDILIDVEDEPEDRKIRERWFGFLNS